MPSYDEDLLSASRVLLGRRTGQRGKVPAARIRRSISTTYYALFHLLLDEVGRRVVGSGSTLRTRRRLLARTIGHRTTKTALDKVRGEFIDASVADFFARAGATGPVASPRFVRDVALAFNDAYSKRQDADYNLNQPFSAADARLLRLRVLRVIRGWLAARMPPDRDAKHALCVLILIKGHLRAEP